MAIVPVQLARVSNLLRSSVSQGQITRTQRNLLDVQNQLSTGKRIIAPSDDPGDAAVTQQLQKLLEQRAFQGAARLVAAVDELMQTILSLA